MLRLLKALVFLLVVGFVALTVYAYLGDLTPDRIEVREPVELDVD